MDKDNKSSAFITVWAAIFAIIVAILLIGGRTLFFKNHNNATLVNETSDCPLLLKYRDDKNPIAKYKNSEREITPEEAEKIREKCQDIAFEGDPNSTSDTNKSTPPVNELETLNAQKLTRAEKAFSTGTKIIDKKGDWFSTGNPQDNPSFYPIGFVDIKEIDIGIDENSLYVRGIFNSKWPENDGDWPSFNGDQVLDDSFSVAIDSDNNPKTGCRADGGTEMSLDIGGRMNMKEGNPPGTYNQYKTHPTGIEDPEEKRYKDFNIFNERIIGGPGYDYFINIYPLSELSLTKGQVVSLKIKAEASSKKYHHAAVDDMNWFNGPTESKLVITLGENKTINFE